MCPTIEFLDDPTKGVDPIAIQELIDTLNILHGSAVLIATEDMNIAEKLCDNVAFMVEGEFVAYGSPQHIKQKYGDGYVLVIKQTLKQMRDFEVPEFMRHNLTREAVKVKGKHLKREYDANDLAERPDSYGTTYEYKLYDGKMSSVFLKL